MMMSVCFHPGTWVKKTRAVCRRSVFRNLLLSCPSSDHLNHVLLTKRWKTSRRRNYAVRIQMFLLLLFFSSFYRYQCYLNIIEVCLHLADAFIQSDLQCIQIIIFFLSVQYMCSLGIEPTTFALLTQCSNHWAAGTLIYYYTFSNI